MQSENFDYSQHSLKSLEAKRSTGNSSCRRPMGEPGVGVSGGRGRFNLHIDLLVWGLQVPGALSLLASQ